MNAIHISPPVDVCVICGCVIPEGRQICPDCEEKWGKSRSEDTDKRKDSRSGHRKENRGKGEQQSGCSRK